MITICARGEAPIGGIWVQEMFVINTLLGNPSSEEIESIEEIGSTHFSEMMNSLQMESFLFLPDAIPGA